MMFSDVHFSNSDQVHSASRRISLVLAARELLAGCGLCALILGWQT